MQFLFACISKHERYSRTFRGKYFLLNFKFLHKTKVEMYIEPTVWQKEILTLVCETKLTVFSKHQPFFEQNLDLKAGRTVKDHILKVAPCSYIILKYKLNFCPAHRYWNAWQLKIDKVILILAVTSLNQFLTYLPWTNFQRVSCIGLVMNEKKLTN